MKTLYSYLRHALTFLAGIGGLLLSYQLIAPGDVATANEAGAALIEPLTTLGGLIAAGLARLIIARVGKLFPGLSESATVDPGRGNNSGGLGGPLLLVTCATAGLMGFSLPSCSPAQIEAAQAVPIRIKFNTPGGDIGYTSKGGLTVDYQTGK